MEVDNDAHIEACCRVCHGSSTQENPLFYPCKCSGSIKFVHQSCLFQWLKVTKRLNCEVCGEKFRFREVYKSDGPTASYWSELVSTLFSWGHVLLFQLIAGFAALVIGIIGLPVFAKWFLDLCWAYLASTSQLILSAKKSNDSVALELLLKWSLGILTMVALAIFAGLFLTIASGVYDMCKESEKRYMDRLQARQREQVQRPNRTAAIHGPEQAASEPEHSDEGIPQQNSPHKLQPTARPASEETENSDVGGVDQSRDEAKLELAGELDGGQLQRSARQPTQECAITGKADAEASGADASQLKSQQGQVLEETVDDAPLSGHPADERLDAPVEEPLPPAIDEPAERDSSAVERPVPPPAPALAAVADEAPADLPAPEPAPEPAPPVPVLPAQRALLAPAALAAAQPAEPAPPIAPVPRAQDPFVEQCITFTTYAAVGYPLVIAAVLLLVVVPALCGGLLLDYTAAGLRIIKRVELAVAAALESEATRDSAIDWLMLNSQLEANGVADRPVLVALVVAHALALLRLVTGHVIGHLLVLSFLVVFYTRFLEIFPFTANITTRVRNVLCALKTCLWVLIVFTPNLLTPSFLLAHTMHTIYRALPQHLVEEGWAMLDTFKMHLIVVPFVIAAGIVGHVCAVWGQLVDAMPKDLLKMRWLFDSTQPESPAEEELMDRLQRIQKLPFLRVLQYGAFHTCALVCVYAVCVLVPVWWGHLLGPFDGPLQFRVDSRDDYWCMTKDIVTLIGPAIPLLSRLQYTSTLHGVVHGIVNLAIKTAHLQRREAAEAAPAGPPDEGTPDEVGAARALFTSVGAYAALLLQWCKLVFVTYAVMALLGVISSWILHAPLVTGRQLLALAGCYGDNDLYCYPVGALVCGIVSYITYFAYRGAATAADWKAAVYVGADRLRHSIVTVFVGGLTLVSVLAAVLVLLEVYVALPFRIGTFFAEHTWTHSISLTNAFARLAYYGQFGATVAISLRLMWQLGFDMFLPEACLRFILLPWCALLADLLAVPFFLAHGVCLMLPSQGPVLGMVGVGDVWQVRELVSRRCYLAYVVVLLAMYGVCYAVMAMRVLHRRVQESQRLVGVELQNRD